ncbi:hypothetical protein Tco_1304853 [Tanacetum coccineum]
MVAEVQIEWLRMWPRKRSWIQEMSEMGVVGPGDVKMVMKVNEIEDRGRSSGQDHLDYGGECWEAKSKLLEAAKLHVHIGLNTYLGKINTHVPTFSYELSILNLASNVILEGNWVSHR